MLPDGASLITHGCIWHSSSAGELDARFSALVLGLDAVSVKIFGERHNLRRVVDYEGDIFESMSAKR